MPGDVEVEVGLARRRAGAGGERARARGRRRGGGYGSASVGSSLADQVGQAGSGYAKEAAGGQGANGAAAGDACVMERRWTAGGAGRRGSRPATGGRWRGRSRWSNRPGPTTARAARALLARAARRRARPALRVGLTGTPGVGKSSFIESLGLMLTGRGRAARGAGGRSVLDALGRLDPRRQDPDGAAGARAGRLHPARARARRRSAASARRTRETILLVEAWGADVVLVETVGVGQSETMVAEMTDVFVLLIAPGRRRRAAGGQARHHGDGRPDPRQQGRRRARAPRRARTRADYAGRAAAAAAAARRPGGLSAGACVSALTGAGLAEAWAAVERAGGGAAGERRLRGAAAGAGGGLVRPRARDRADRAARRRSGDGGAAAGAGGGGGGGGDRARTPPPRRCSTAIFGKE